jgi:hypothetical protein
LKGGGQTFFTYNETDSYVLVDCTLLGNLTGVSGDGVLASIQLHVQGQGSCDLLLGDVQLINSVQQTVSNTVNNGYFSASS